MTGLEPVLIGKLVGMAVYMGIEYFLGKTDKVKAGSVLELVFNAAKYIAGKSDEKK